MNRDRLAALKRIDSLCEQFEALLRNGEEVEIAEWIRLVDKSDRPDLFLELLRLETHHRPKQASDRGIGDYFRTFPEFSNEIVRVFADNRKTDFSESTMQPSLNSLERAAAGELIDRFRIISLLGAGGFASVFLAHDPERNQAVALKVLHASDPNDSSRHFESIVNEANVLSRIDHAAIPKVFDVGEDKNGRPWVAMEFIKGDSLYNLLATDQLSLVEVLHILVKTANALHKIHEAGFSHRDIKPDNIIIGLDGEPRILDYGLALHEDTQRDKAGERAGTTAFMSPEQAQGQSENLDGRTDIWSLGVILYLVIAKRLPFHGDTKEDVRQEILNRPVKPPRQIKNNIATSELEDICFRALKKHPEDRYSTASDFADELNNAITALPAEFLLQEVSRTRRLTKQEQCTVQLAHQSRQWDAHRSSENLPGFMRYFRFKFRTNKKLWSESEAAMMSATARHFGKLALILSMLVTILFGAGHYIQRTEIDNRVDEVVAAIAIAPISEVESQFEELSSFAPEMCLEAVREAFVDTSSNAEMASENLRYGIVLAPTHPPFKATFKKSLIDAKEDEIDTLSRLSFPDRRAGTIPVLDDQWRRELTQVVATSPYVPGIESIWQSPTDQIVQQFELNGGKLTPGYAMTLRMPLEEFKTALEQLRQFRYQPVCIRPWVDDDKQIQIAAVWHRRSCDWKIGWNLTPQEFNQINARESMVLADVSDGLQLPGADPSLVAVWSSIESPYGKSRHMLLAEKIPQISDPKWNDLKSLNHSIIAKDVSTNYLLDAPLLVDVQLHADSYFKPDVAREQQKLSVGEMILRVCQPSYQMIPDTPEYHRLEVGSKMKAEAFYALDQFEKSSDHFQRQLEEGTWPEVLIRTLSLARSGHAASANHSKALLRKKLTRAVQLKKDSRPFVTLGIARAIDLSVQAEMDFWESGDAREFIKWATNRTRRVKASDDPKKFTQWAEYYSIALAASSVAKAIKGNESRSGKRNLQELNRLKGQLVADCIKLRPSLKQKFTQHHDSQILTGSRLIDGFLTRQQMPVRSSAWSATTSNYESRFIEPRTKNSHVAASENLHEEGFFPVATVLGNHLAGNPKIGSIWHRELETAELANREQRLANAFCIALYHGEDVGIWTVLRSPNSYPLKQRIIETVHKFKINASILMNRLDGSANRHERLSILKSLRNYSPAAMSSEAMEHAMSSLSRIEQLGTKEEVDLAAIIRLNLSPIRTANTTQKQ